MEAFNKKINEAEYTLTKIYAERLYREYDQIIYCYRLPLKQPVIRVENLSSKWGEWNPLTRTITLSYSLIKKHSWDIVLEILKHEIAHQIVSESFSSPEKHGPDFFRACEMLGVADWAIKSGGELPLEIPLNQDRKLSEQEERLLKRLEKLLSLATSSNEHEALLAMKRVQELYLKYNLDRIKEKQNQDMVYLIINRKKKKISQIESQIFSILGEHFFVQIIYNQLFDAKDLCTYKVAEILGARENVLMAEYVYHFLWEKIHSLWRTYQEQTQAGLAEKGSYLCGLLSGFSSKLSEEKISTKNTGFPQASSLETTALIKIMDHELNTFVHKRYPRLSTRSWHSGYRDQSTFLAGVNDGKAITLQKPISTKQTDKILFLKA